MTFYIYSRSESFKSHISKLMLAHATYRQDLNNIKASAGDIVLIHGDSFSAQNLTDALRESSASSYAVAVAEEFPDLGKMLRYANLGLSGYCNAYMAKAHYEQLVFMLQSGQSWFPPSLLSQALAVAHTSVRPEESHEQLLELTSRQRQIALCAAEGKSNKDIAEECGIAERTVKSHLTQIFEKLGVTDRIGLVIHLKKLNMLGSNKR
jgi:DNA-binding NarL/FixJ family response regulator